MGSSPAPEPMAVKPRVLRHELRQVKQRGEEDGRGQQRGDSGGEKGAVLHDRCWARERCRRRGVRSTGMRPAQRGRDTNRKRIERRGPAEIESPSRGRAAAPAGRRKARSAEIVDASVVLVDDVARDDHSHRDEYAAAATGRLTKKIQRHPTVSVSRPPSNGPTALPNPAAPRITPPASPAFSRGSRAVGHAEDGGPHHGAANAHQEAASEQQGQRWVRILR